MSKGNQNSVAVQYKVHLKPTEVGALVMKRMERPHLDKSAELRRLIELGFAAEQAGFILDGTVLRNGGRVWDVKSDPAANPATGRSNTVDPLHAQTSAVEAVESVGDSHEESMNAIVAGSLPDTAAQAGAGTKLRANLRRLSST